LLATLDFATCSGLVVVKPLKFRLGLSLRFLLAVMSLLSEGTATSYLYVVCIGADVATGNVATSSVRGDATATAQQN
jgi:hypothetical protein